VAECGASAEGWRERLPNYLADGGPFPPSPSPPDAATVKPRSVSRGFYFEARGLTRRSLSAHPAGSAALGLIVPFLGRVARVALEDGADVHFGRSNNVVEYGTVKTFHFGECFKKF